MFIGKKRGCQRRDIQAVFVMESDGTDYLLAPDGSGRQMEESSLTPHGLKVIRAMRTIPAKTRTRIFISRK